LFFSPAPYRPEFFHGKNFIPKPVQACPLKIPTRTKVQLIFMIILPSVSGAFYSKAMANISSSKENPYQKPTIHGLSFARMCKTILRAVFQ
jgi:hypothetical protein